MILVHTIYYEHFTRLSVRVLHSTSIARFLHTTAPKSRSCLKFETNIIECSNALCCHETWLSFVIRLGVVALMRNPLPELGIGCITVWHEAVAEVHLEFAQLFKLFVPTNSSCPQSKLIPLSARIHSAGTRLGVPSGYNKGLGFSSVLFL